MKKSELKNIIKECVKEVIFEEGVLSGIISEVATGLQSSATIQERYAPVSPQSRAPQTAQLAETKKKVLSAIGGNAYEDIKSKFSNPELFEGTKPLPDSGGQKQSRAGALSGIDPRDPGVDLSSIPGMGSWATIATAKGNR
jgi:hypothetical protein